MKRFENGDALSKEFGLPPAVLKKTFEDYNQSVRSKKDPFGKKVCVNGANVTLEHLYIVPCSFSRVNGVTTTSSTSLS